MWWGFLQVCEDIGGHMQAQPRRRKSLLSTPFDWLQSNQWDVPLSNTAIQESGSWKEMSDQI